MSNGYGSFENGPSGYISYRIFKETYKSGGKGPSSNGGCLTSVISVIAFVFMLITLFL